MMVIGKVNGKIVEVVHVADRVAFSKDCGWVCVCHDFDQIKRRQQNIKWIPASTVFDWVREFNFV